MKSINTLIPDIYNVMESKQYDGDLNSIAMQAGREVEDAIKDAFTPREETRENLKNLELQEKRKEIGGKDDRDWETYHKR